MTTPDPSAPAGADRRADAGPTTADAEGTNPDAERTTTAADGVPADHGLARLDATGFDIRAFTRSAQGTMRARLDLDAYATAPLRDDELRLLRHLGRLEGATMEHLRNLLVTATHKDARVTAFLVTWAYEKFWLADSLDAVLEAHGRPRLRDDEEAAPRRSVTERAERRGPIRRAILAAGLGAPIIAVHTTSGLVDEWVLQYAYERLAARTDSPALRSHVDLVLGVKRRHEAFFADETDRRLRESGRAVKQTRDHLAHAVWPIGTVDRAADERDFFDDTVWGDADGRARAAEVGARVAALPGLGDADGRATTRGLLR